MNAQHTPGPWSPFATAPHDGTRVLAYWPRHPVNDDDKIDELIDLGGIQAVTWKNNNSWIEPDCLEALGPWFGDAFCYAKAPTFWMPLPASPAKATGSTT